MDNSAGAENGPEYFNNKDFVWDFRIINIEAFLRKHGSDYFDTQDMRVAMQLTLQEQPLKYGEAILQTEIGSGYSHNIYVK